eukprot:GHUV01015278.1.p1 GENE.GHUV01015278.1~~GHUV01015278.1.p1  ORF type:complete len:330 (+),score=78.71 GHUV01015278.1:470-1459(+)
MSPATRDDVGVTGDGPDGSVIAERYMTGQWQHAKGEYIPERYPTNREVAKAIEQQVSASVDIFRKYRHVTWYTIFVGLYMLVLYFQASSFKSGEVVATLKQALLPDGTTTTLSFSSDDQVLDYIGTRIIKPIWKDPVCGDSKCEVPWEFPAWGPFGCQADCGLNPNTTRVIVRVSADFTGHPSISPKTLMGQVTWNLCLNDTLRTKRGLPALCWFQDDQVFTDEIETQIKAVNLIDGDWYIRLEGDFAGRVTGAVYDGTQDDLVEVPVSPAWEGCKFKRRRIATASTTGRRRLQGVANGNAGPGQQTPRAAAPDTGRPQQSSSASHHDL